MKISGLNGHILEILELWIAVWYIVTALPGWLRIYFSRSGSVIYFESVKNASIERLFLWLLWGEIVRALMWFSGKNFTVHKLQWDVWLSNIKRTGFWLLRVWCDFSNLTTNLKQIAIHVARVWTPFLLRKEELHPIILPSFAFG